jgi:Domain of unknown function (DUF4160)
MPALSRFFGIVITMNWNDHQLPHFHARYAEHEAVIRVDTLELESGHLLRRALTMVLEWTSLHRAELRENWRRARDLQPLSPIAPLE